MPRRLHKYKDEIVNLSKNDLIQQISKMKVFLSSNNAKKNNL